MTDQVTRYLRNRAAVLRDRYNGVNLIRDGNAHRLPTETEVSEAMFAVRQIEVLADEIDAEFHVDDDED